MVAKDLARVPVPCSRESVQERSVSHRTSDAERLEPTVAKEDPLHVDELEEYGSRRCQIVAIWPEDPAQLTQIGIGDRGPPCNFRLAPFFAKEKKRMR